MKSERKLLDDAVSPVVGVMLMLVVTIIIAALVSSFAGGLGASTEATPTVTFTVDYSRDDGLLLTCAGASSGLTFGSDFNVLVSDLTDNPAYYQVNTSMFNDGVDEKFTAGRSIYINKTNLYDALGEYGEGGQAGYTSWITASDNYDIEGETFTVRLVSDKHGVIGTATGVVKA
mgnify:CR=1 FL=1